MNLDLSFANGKSEVPAKVLDPVSAKDRISRFEDEIQKLLIQCRELVIDSDKKALVAAEMLAQVKRLQKDLKSKQDEIIKNPYEFVKYVKRIANPFFSLLEEMEKKILKPKLGEYNYQKELKRREEIKRLEIEHQKKQDEIYKAAEKSGVSKKGLELPKPVLKKDQSPIRTESGSASTTMKWKGEIIDADKVPKKYCSPDQKKIDQAVKAGIRKIAGVRIFEEPQTRVRIS